MEKHLQTLIGAILIGLVGWTGVSVTESRESIARMDERFNNLTSTIDDLKQKVGDGYELRLQMRDLTHSISSCHTKIKVIEHHLNLKEL